MTVPSTATIAKWRHVVRVIVRLVAVVFVLVSVASLFWSILSVAIMWPQGGGIAFGASPLIPILLLLRPLVWAVIGVALFRLDLRLARLIVPMPSKGCPNCGYWLGSRELGRCPECGVELSGDAS